MKVTPENRHKVVESLLDLKGQIGDNEVLEFDYAVRFENGNKLVSVDFVIKPNA